MNSSRARVRDRLAAYDGQATTLLTEAAAEFGRQPGYLDDLIALAGDAEPVVSDGSTWLIKHHLEAGDALSAGQTTALLAQAERITGWTAMLHLCQSVRRLTIAEAEVEALVDWLRPLLSHPRPFLRAWSLDALCAVGEQWPRFAQQAWDALASASDDHAESVRARARNLARG